MIKLKKLIETKKEGEYEIDKTHIITTELEKRIYDIIYDLTECVDDPESQYNSYGISTDFDGGIVCINLDRLCEQITTELENFDENDYNLTREEYRDLIKYLKKYEGYILWW